MNEEHKSSGHQRLIAEDLTLIAKRTVKLGPSVIEVSPVTRSPGGVSAQREMAARLGDLFYRAACAVAVVWAAFILVLTATLPLPDWTIASPTAAGGAVLIWILGRAARYVLSG
jgi:hypothetical protein